MTHRVRGWRVLAALLLTAGLAACSRQVELMAALPATEANEIIAALQNAGIHADKVAGKEGLAAVKVAAGDVGRAVDLLRDKGLPRERFAGMGQVFKKEGLISSPLEERARYVYALSQELGATLSQIDGVGRSVVGAGDRGAGRGRLPGVETGVAAAILAPAAAGAGVTHAGHRTRRLAGSTAGSSISGV